MCTSQRPANGADSEPLPPRVRPDLSAQELCDATLRFIAAMRVSEPLYDDPVKAHDKALNSVKVFVEALAAEDTPEPRRVA